MSCVRVRIVLYFTCVKRPRRMLKTQMECWSVLMKRCGDVDMFMTRLCIYHHVWIDTLFDIPRDMRCMSLSIVCYELRNCKVFLVRPRQLRKHNHDW